jgi:putative transposase
MTKALPIKLSSRQEQLLQQIVRETTNPYRLIRRAKLILAAASGESNSSISRRLELDRQQVALWRERWKDQSEFLESAEGQQVTDKKLRALPIANFKRSPTTRDKKILYSRTSGQNCGYSLWIPWKIRKASKSLDCKRVSARSYKKRNCRSYFPPKCGAFFKMKLHSNRIAIVTG